MDSRSDQTSYPRGHAKRLLETLSRVLADSLDHGLQATCDLHISYRNGRELARCRVSVSRDNAGEVVEREVQAASGQAPATGKTEVGNRRDGWDFSGMNPRPTYGGCGGR